MKPAPFRYHRARDLTGATRLLAELGEDAKVIAGGQSLVAMMNFRLARPQHLIDIAGLRELDHLGTDADGALRVGALTTHHTVETAPPGTLGAEFEVIRAAMGWIGHLPIRTRGTAGGSIAHADATAEWCLLAVALDAAFLVHGPRGRRRITAGDFFLGPYTTALDPDELLTEIVFPRPAPYAALTEFAARRGTSRSCRRRWTSMSRVRWCAAAGWRSAVWRRCRYGCPRRRRCWPAAARSPRARRRPRPPSSRRTTPTAARPTGSS